MADELTAPRTRARVVKVGEVILSGWEFEGGDYAPIDAVQPGLVCGYSLVELAQMAAEALRSQVASDVGLTR